MVSTGAGAATCGNQSVSATAYGGGNIQLGDLLGTDTKGSVDTVGTVNLRTFAGSTSTSAIGGDVVVRDVVRNSLIVRAANFRSRDVNHNTSGLNIGLGGDIVFRDLVSANGATVSFQSSNHNFRFRSITTTG
ncbi:MAG: hypothetical protein ACPH93_05980, partial [Candidatus Poseidoniaceae archaeon]